MELHNMSHYLSPRLSQFSHATLKSWGLHTLFSWARRGVACDYLWSLCLSPLFLWLHIFLKLSGCVVFGEPIAASLGTDGTNYWHTCWRHAAGEAWAIIAHSGSVKITSFHWYRSCYGATSPSWSIHTRLPHEPTGKVRVVVWHI